MRFRPRHYVLIAIIVALGIFNIVRRHRAVAPQPVAPPPSVSITRTVPPESAAAWQAFDKVAALRDAPDAQFQPALQALQQQIDATQPPDAAADVKGCRTWLMFYRQSVVHPSPDTTWKTRSTQHLDTCVKTHQDSTQ
jgi:hypothetical protein